MHDEITCKNKVTYKLIYTFIFNKLQVCSFSQICFTGYWYDNDKLK